MSMMDNMDIVHDHAASTDVDFVHDEAIQEPIDATWTPPVAIPVTGDDRVDSALTLLSGLNPDDVHSHVDVLQEVHDRLREVLADGANA